MKTTRSFIKNEVTKITLFDLRSFKLKVRHLPCKMKKNPSHLSFSFILRTQKIREERH